MILENMQDQLVDNAKLDFVAANEALVGIIAVIESNYLATGRVRLENVSEKDTVASIIRLCELLALGGRDFRPLREQINLLGELDFHRLFAIGKLVLVTVKRAIAGNREVHEKAPPEIFTFVLKELEELFSGGNRNVKTIMIDGGFQCNKPAFLISLLREIQDLSKGLMRLCKSHFVGGRKGSRERALVAKRAAKVR